jgi:uncharacterized protein
MSDSIDVTICDERVQLRADRTLFWPRENALIIADLHLGKADTFRSAGVALPSGGTLSDLSRLTLAIERTSAKRIIVLGDMIHGAATERRWHDGWNAWREHHPALQIVAIAGNHDRALRRLNLDIDYHAESIDMPPFELRHAPRAQSDSHVLCGHIHPVVRLPRIIGRWPAFVMDERQTLLPAFSMFTGGYLIDLTGKRFAVCNGGSIALLGNDGSSNPGLE